MDVHKVKKECSEDEITIEYNEISRKPLHSLKTPKIEYKGSTNKTVEPKENFINKSLKMEAKDKIVGNNLGNNRPKLLLENNNQIQPDKIKISAIRTTATCKNLAVSDVTKLLLNDSFSKNRKVTVSNGNKHNLYVGQTEPPKSTFKTFSDSCKEVPGSSDIRPDHPLYLSGAEFVHAQVHSNSVLQSLLKDIISLNNEKDDINEDTISKEIAKLRSKNNLPSLNPEVPIILEDSDYSEGSEDESSYYDTKVSENYGKDSGYDNESQYSESLDDDNSTSLVQDSLGNQAEKFLVIAEPEYIDLDNYFGKKGKLTLIRSLEDLRTVPKPSNESTLKLHGLMCPICKKTLKSRKTYRHHTKNGTGCLKKSPNHNKLFSCKGNCKFFGSKDDFFKHKQEKHSNQRQNDNKTTIKDNTRTPISCEKKCDLSFINTVSLQRHYTTHHKQISCLFCNFSCENLSDYNLHISNKHSKRVRRESCSSDSDGLQIVEIDGAG